jgi:hypothetical protein
LIIKLLVLFFINISNGLLVLPYNNVPATIAAGDKIGIPISNEKFIISNCAALGKSYLYTENNEVTDYSPVAYFRDATTLELYIPDVGSNTSKKYFIVVELPLAEAIIKTDKFTVTPGSNINLPKTDGCGKTVRFSNKEDIGSTISGKINTDNNGNNLNANNSNINTNLNNNVNNNNGNANGNETNNINGNNVANNNNGDNNNGNNNGKIGNNKSNILTAESATDTTAEEEGGTNNAVIIALSGTSVVALVVISGFVLMRKKSYMKKGDSDISYSSLNYVSPKPYDPVGGLYDNLTNSNNDYERDYQLRCLQNDNQSQVSYPISLSDGSCVNMDKNSDVFETTENIPVPSLPRDLPRNSPSNSPRELPPNDNQEDLPITKHVVEEIVINPEKVLSETINSNAVSAFVTTASVALAINECGDLTIDNSNIIVEKPNTTTEKSNSTSSTCTSCSTSSCSSCNNCSCSCNGSGTCSCTCNESSRYTTTTTDESSLKLLSLDLNNSKPFTSFNFANNSNMGDTTRGYSVFVDNDSKKDSVAYTETNYDDSRRMTNYTETDYYDSRRMTDYTETTGYDDSRRDTQYTDYTTDSRRDTQYTDYTTDSRRDTQYTDYTVDSRRDTQYTDYTVDSRRDTQYTDYTVDSRRDTQYTDYTVDSRRDTQYTDYTVDSRRDTQYTDYTTEDSRRDTQYTDYTTEDSRRDTQYTDYTEGTSYTTDRDSRRYTDYTEGSSYTNRDSRYTDYTGDSYSSCSCSGSECECGRRNTQYSEYTSEYTSYTTDSRRQTYTTDYTSTQYSESRDVSESEPSRILPLSTLEPFGGIANTSSFIEVLQSKQPALRESVYSLLPTGPITSKPPKLDIEFVAQNDLETDKPGELVIKKRDVIRIVENLDGGYYMASNGTTGASGKIPAHKILSIL